MGQHPTRSDATPEGGIGGRRSWGYCAMATMDGQVPLKKNVWDVTFRQHELGVSENKVV